MDTTERAKELAAKCLAEAHLRKGVGEDDNAEFFRAISNTLTELTTDLENWKADFKTIDRIFRSTFARYDDLRKRHLELLRDIKKKGD
jgi:hypothetical protein